LIQLHDEINKGLIEGIKKYSRSLHALQLYVIRKLSGLEDFFD
jgi:hypothetical protein